MAKVLSVVLECEACGHIFRLSKAKSTVTCPLCNTPQSINIPHDRIGTAFLALRGTRE